MIRTIPDVKFNLVLVGVAGGHFVICLLFEMLIVEQSAIWEWFRRFSSHHVSKRYKVISRQLDCDHVNFDQVIETGQSDVLNPLVVLNKPIVSKVVVNGIDKITNKTRL